MKEWRIFLKYLKNFRILFPSKVTWVDLLFSLLTFRKVANAITKKNDITISNMNIETEMKKIKHFLSNLLKKLKKSALPRSLFRSENTFSKCDIQKFLYFVCIMR